MFKNIGIIIHSRPTYDMAWERLVANDSNTILILITNAAGKKKLTEAQRGLFQTIYETPNFDIHPLQKIFTQIRKNFYSLGDKTWVSAVTEFEQLVTAELRDHFRELLNIQGPGLSAISPFRDKLRMKAILRLKGVRLPKYMAFESSLFELEPDEYIKTIEATLTYPIFTKPIDGASSLGTKLIRNREELHRWCTEKSKESQVYELDEYIEGRLFHCDSIVREREILFTFVSKYLHPNADARNGLPLASMTLDPLDPDYQRLKIFAENALDQFPDLPNGVTHLEAFISKNDELIFLEVAARPPGSRVTEVYEIRYGVNIREIHTKLNLGLSIGDQLAQLDNAANWGPYAGLLDVVTPGEDSVIEEIHTPLWESNYWKRISYQVNDLVRGGIKNSEVIATFVFWHPHYKTIESDFYGLNHQQLISYQAVSVEQKQPQESTNPLFVPPVGINNRGQNFCRILGKPPLFISALSIFSPSTVRTENQPVYSNNRTEVNLTLYLCLLAGSAAIVALSLYILFRYINLIKGDTNRNEGQHSDVTQVTTRDLPSPSQNNS